MSKICSHEGCTADVFSKDLCMMHWRQMYARPIQRVYSGDKIYQKKPRTRIPVKRVSDKRAEENPIYHIKREAFLKEHPKCEIPAPGCWTISVQVHHPEGREGDRFLDDTKWKAACGGPCHDYWTEHSAEAIALGYSLTRITPVHRVTFNQRE